MAKKSKALDEELEVEIEDDEEEVSISFDVATYPSDLTLSGIYQMWQSKDIVIPDYQRNYVWSIKQASLLIESFLIGLPVPPVFLYIEEDGKSQVIDGQQRLTSVAYFMDGYFGPENQGKRQTFRLQGLGKNSPFLNKSLHELDEASQRKLRNTVLRAINVRQLSPEGAPTSAYHIFERLNTGGTELKPQEIRNCVYHGDFVTVLRLLNEHGSWREILGKAALDKHQKDVELVLRIFCFTYFGSQYEKPMKEFLNKWMKAERRGNSEHVTAFGRDFAKMADYIVSTLGPKPFHLRSRLNSSALDAVFVTLLRSKDKIPKDLAARYDRLKADEEFNKTTILSTSDTAIIERRFDITKRFLLD